MPKFGKRLDGVGGRRVAAREAVLLPACVSTVSATRTVDLLNVSSSGAKLRGDKLPTPGTDVLLRSGPVDTMATVVWSVNGVCGVTFDRELSDADVAQLRRENKWALEAKLTPEERLAAEDWLTGFAR